jgi:DNA invertase Pin-like site-specific DNA recombinase
MPVAGYFRISRARDGMHAPDIYCEQIKRYCDYRTLDLSEIYSDIDSSGYRNSEKRPALRRLVEERCRYSAIVIPKLSRFGRSLRHLSELFELFDSDGVDLIFMDIGIDTGSSQGRLLRNVMSSFAEYESDVRSDYSKAAHRYRTERGYPNGNAPYGYERSGKSFRINESKANLVFEVFESYAAGQNFRSRSLWTSIEEAFRRRAGATGSHHRARDPRSSGLRRIHLARRHKISHQPSRPA